MDTRLLQWRRGSALQATMSPYGLATDGQGNLYISDNMNNNVRVVNLATGIIETIAGSATGVSGYSGDGGPALQATMNAPGGLRYDGAGHLLLSDFGNHAIRQIDLTTHIITTVAGSGTPGYTGDGGKPAAATLNLPNASAVDGNGNLYIADSGNDRIRVLTTGPAGLVSLTGTLTATPVNAVSGGAVTLTATFNGLTAGAVPALGTVTFFDGQTELTGSAFTFVTNSNSLVVTLTDSNLAVGTHTITAAFSGDSHYAAATTGPVTVTVAAAVPPSFSVAASPAALTVKQGGSGTDVFTLTPAGGFSSTVTFTCGSGLPTGVSCSFSPASVTPSGSTPLTTTLTITTTGSSTARLAPSRLAAAVVDGGQRHQSCVPASASIAPSCMLHGARGSHPGRRHGRLRALAQAATPRPPQSIRIPRRPGRTRSTYPRQAER